MDYFFGFGVAVPPAVTTEDQDAAEQQLYEAIQHMLDGFKDE